MNIQRAGTLFVALLALSGLSQTAHAGLVAYQIDYTVEYFLNETISRPNPAVVLGNVYHGSFAIDDSVLAADGLNKPGVVFAFDTQMENAIWSSNSPWPASEFEAYRGPETGLGSGSPGFDVVGGEIVNLRGGLVGPGDASFIDFSSNYRPGAPLFQYPTADGCVGNYCGNQANQFFTRNSGDVMHPLQFAFGGSMTVHREVPAPGPLSLLVGGALLVAWRMRRTIATTKLRDGTTLRAGRDHSAD